MISKRAEIKSELPLTPLEDKTFDLLRAVAEETETTVRVAGGWVRDRLLNKPSDDIDITVDNMGGAEFAKKIEEFARKNNIEDVGTGHEMEAAPGKRREIPTGTIKIFGNTIEVMPLRKDVGYSELNRDPDIELVGNNPQEDAKRRDFTINALFYNIHNGKVEDYVGGKEDVKKGIIRTPIDPLKSFSDDPLRIMRAIRFAARLGFPIDPNTEKAIKNPEIQKLFKAKIPKEIIAKELFKMLTSKRPDLAAKKMFELGLRDEIFAIDPEFLQDLDIEELEDWSTDQESSYHKLNFWEHSVEALKNMSQMTPEEIPNEERFIRNLAALLHDLGKRYRGIQEKTPDGFKSYKRHEVYSEIIAKSIVRNLKINSLQSEKKDMVPRIIRLIRNHMRLHQLQNSEHVKGAALRRVINEMKDNLEDGIRYDWENLIDLSIADYKAKDFNVNEKVPFYEELRERMRAEQERAEKAQISILDGREIIDLYRTHFNLEMKPGQWIGQIKKHLMELQLENPEITKEDAQKIVLEKFPKDKLLEVGAFKISSRDKPLMSKRAAKKPQQMDFSEIIWSPEEKELSRETIKRKYDLYMKELDMTQRFMDEFEPDRKVQRPTLGEFIARKIYEYVDDEELEQQAIDMARPLYDLNNEIGVTGHGSGGNAGGDMTGTVFPGGTVPAGTGEGIAGGPAIFSLDISTASFKKSAQATFGSLYRAKCPKCSRWVRMTTSQYVANKNRIRCPRHGWVKPKRFKMMSLADLFRNKAA